MYDLSHALNKLYSNCNWYLKGDKYSGLVWEDKNTPKPSEQELLQCLSELQNGESMDKLRLLRNKLLNETDKYTIPDWPHETPEKRQEWLEYRQQLRDLPSNSSPMLDSDGKLTNVSWPVSPLQ